MAEVNVGGVQPYTISLDNLDLMHLSKYVQNPKVEKTPLWTKRCLDGEAEYYQVKIVPPHVHEDCYSESSDTYTCHICNTHVPIIFTKEHNRSDQHETFKNIFQKLLERVSKQINLSIVDNDREIDNETYYCAPCSRIIKFTNKFKHEASEYHVKSEKNMMIVNEFYEIIKKHLNGEVSIADVDEESELEYVHSKSTPIKNSNLFKSCSNSTLDSDECLSVSINNSFDLSPTLDAMDIESKINTKNRPIPNVQSDKLENFEDYLKEMIKKYNLGIELLAVCGDNVSLVSPSGDKVNVSREHFQSYRQLENSIYCQLCKMWISQDTRPHDVTENHVRHIFSPINEKFARVINSVSSHCVPCNEVVLTYSNHHIIDDTHKKIIKDTRSPYAGKTFCEDCNYYIDTHNFAVHIKSKKHLTVLMEKHSISQLENGDIYFCNICKINLHQNDLKFHVNSKTHTTIKNNDLTKVNNKNNDSAAINNKNNDSADVNVDDSGYCNTCKVKVPRGGMKEHVAGKSHKTVISNLYSENKNELKSKEGTAQNGVKAGSVAHSSVSNNMNALSTSSTAVTTPSELSNVTKHRSDKKMDSYYDQLVFTDNTKMKVTCKICYIIMNFVERDIIRHMESMIHVEISNTLKMLDYKKFLVNTNDAKTVECVICDVKVTLGDRNIIEHMEGRNHNTAENELLKFHMVSKVESGFVCKCCNINTTNYFEHINSRKHTIEFLNTNVIDKLEMRRYVYEDDDIGGAVARRYRELYTNLRKHNNIIFKEVDGFSYNCEICQIKLGRINEIDHALGERHRLKLNEINKLMS